MKIHLNILLCMLFLEVLAIGVWFLTGEGYHIITMAITYIILEIVANVSDSIEAKETKDNETK